MKIKLEVEALPYLIRVADTLEETIRETMEAHAKVAYDVFIDNSPEWRGTFKNSVKVYKYYSSKGFSVTIGSNLPYAHVLDVGRPPGTYPKLYPKLAQWAEDKGLNLYRVASSIYKKGTKPKYILNNVIATLHKKDFIESHKEEISIEKVKNILKEIGAELEDAGK